MNQLAARYPFAFARRSPAALARWSPIAGVCIVYALALGLTWPTFAGDTIDYVASILDPQATDFWEFGHLLWRPLVAILATPVQQITGWSLFLAVSYISIWLNVLAGLAAAILLYQLLSRFAAGRFIPLVGTIAFICSHAMLNYAQVGTTYVPGLALLLAGTLLMVNASDDDRRSSIRAIAAGFLLALAVGMWFLYLLALPALLLTPTCLNGWRRPQVRTAAYATLAAAIGGALMYGAVIIHLGLFTLLELRAWIAESSHGISISGFTRAVFGFARSFIHTGQDGVLFKRFLLDDPYAPVSAVNLLGATLWKIGWFYLAILSIVISLLRSPLGRRVALWSLIAALPALGFACFWQGGDMERYFPLYPFIFISLALVLAMPIHVFWKLIPLLFFAVAAIVNLQNLASSTVRQRLDLAAARVHDIPTPSTGYSTLLTVPQQDPLVLLDRYSPIEPAYANPRLRIYAWIMPGTDTAPRHRAVFLMRARDAWSAGGELWLTRRLLAERPHPRWNWVEGDDRRISWAQLHAFASALQSDASIGGDDGFIRIPPTPQNLQLLTAP